MPSKSSTRKTSRKPDPAAPAPEVPETAEPVDALSAGQALDLDQLSGPPAEEPAADPLQEEQPEEPPQVEQTREAGPQVEQTREAGPQVAAEAPPEPPPAEQPQADEPAHLLIVVRRPHRFAGEERPIGWPLAEVRLAPGVDINTVVDAVRTGFATDAPAAPVRTAD